MAAKVHEYIPNVNEKPHVRVTSDKFKQDFLISPSNDGFIFYKVSTTKGSVPRELAGMFTQMKKAVDAVLDYERKSQGTQAVQRDKKAEVRHAAKLQRNSTEHVRTGADNGEG